MFYLGTLHSLRKQLRMMEKIVSNDIWLSPPTGKCPCLFQGTWGLLPGFSQHPAALALRTGSGFMVLLILATYICPQSMKGHSNSEMSGQLTRDIGWRYFLP